MREGDLLGLSALNAAYEEWCSRVARVTNVLTLETDGLDLVQDEAAIEQVLASVVGRLGPVHLEEQPAEFGLELASI